MRRHPAGRIERLIAEAQDRQAMDLANRELVALDEWAGGPMRTTVDPDRAARRIPEWVAGVMFGLLVYLAITVVSIAGAMAGGWPA